MCRVLFLYATSNSGHQKAAEAIEKSIRLHAPSIKTFGVDFFTYHYPTLGPFIFRMYLDLMQSMPHVWDSMYDSPELATLTTELRQFFNLLNTPKLHRVLAQCKPDLIVSTQAVPAGFIAAEKLKGNISIPHFVTLTDFVANPYWPAHGVDRYFVPHREIKEQLTLRGIAENKIRVTGIPIDESFMARLPRSVVRKRLGLAPETPTVLFMGGSKGLGQIAPAITGLMKKSSRSIQIIAVTGNNRTLFRNLKKKCRQNKNVIVFSSVKSVGKLMDAADILVSKPGGLTSSEALVKNLPMIILSPLPGQEERNAAFLTRYGVAERCDKVTHLPRMIEQMLSHPDRMRRYQMQAARLAQPYASRNAADIIIGYLQ